MWAANKENVRQTLMLYRTRIDLTCVGIAAHLGTTAQTVRLVLQNNMPEAEKKALAAVRYSRSKQGNKNPMRGKTGPAHHNWVGVCDDGYGYLTCLHKGKRRFVHRAVMAKELNLLALPKHLDVHHIDGDPRNNNPDNLAVVTKQGHNSLHFLARPETKRLQLKRSTIEEYLRSTT